MAAALLPARAAAAISPLVAVRTATTAPVARRWPAPGVLLATTVLAVAALAAQVWLDSGWAGNVAAVATDVALVCLFMRLAGRLSAVVLGPLRGRLGFADRLAVDRLARIPDQLALAGAVLALGLGLMLMAGTLSRSFEESVLDFIHHQVRADLVVASTASTGWIESPLPESIGERLAALPGVTRVERVRLAEHQFRDERISIDSLDASAFAPERRGDFVFAAGDPDAALAAVRGGDGRPRVAQLRAPLRRHGRLTARPRHAGGPVRADRCRRRRRLRVAARERDHHPRHLDALVEGPQRQPLPRVAGPRRPPARRCGARSRPTSDARKASRC